MKKLLALCLMLSLAVAVNAQSSKKSGKKSSGKETKKEAKAEPKFEEGAPTSAVRWDKMVWDFGEVAYGSDVSHVFNFKNVSKNPVAISNVGTSCGCTTPSYVKEPVAPGATGTVTAKYDSSRIGAFTKTLTVDINGEQIILTIKGTIKQPEPQNNNNQSK